MSEIMLVKNCQAFNVTRKGGLHPMSFDRHLATHLLTSVYSGVLEEPLPDRLKSLVEEIEGRERVSHGANEGRHTSM